jgi:hypothetical protein
VVHSHVVIILALFEAALVFACEVGGFSGSDAQILSKARSTR